MMRKICLIILMGITTCIVISLFPIKAEALLAPDYDLQAAVENAELIVRGRVIETRSEWVEGSYGRNIFTYVIIRVELAIKGDPISEEIAFRVMGGTVGDITQTVSDSASFFPDEDAIVLLSYPESGPGILEVLPGYGKIPVIEENVSWEGSIIAAEDFAHALHTFIDNPDYNLDQLLELYQDLSAPLIQDHTEMIEVYPSAPPVEVEEREYQDRIQAVEREHLSTEQAGAPDLRPYKLPDWDNTIVISNKKGTGTSDTIYDDETIYVDFACVNSGDGDAGRFRYGLYIDGTRVGYAELSSLAAGYINYVTDAPIDAPSAGPHTFKVVCDYNNQVSESNEGNNQYSRSITIKKSGNQLPDLKPDKLPDWDNKIVISNETGTGTTSDPIYDDETIYVDFACANSGDGDAGRFRYGLYIDGTRVGYAEPSSLAAGYINYVTDAPIDALSAGPHTFKVVCDYNNQVSESNEGNNQYSRSITIFEDPKKPEISSISPNKGSAGTGTQVTITGKGFGVTAGNGRVEFWYGRGSPGDPDRIEAPIVSWADTQIVCEIPVATLNDYPASAGSGPLRVVTNEGRGSNEVMFIVRFSYWGIMWDNLYGNPEVQYRINENTSDCTAEGTAVRAAAETWNNVSAAFTFKYAGSHSNIETGENDYNDIMWCNNVSSGTIAYASIWSNKYTGMIVETDIAFNDKYYRWSSSSNLGFDESDIQSIATHELGHWLSLRDLYGDIGDGDNDVGKIMYGRGSPGEMKRNLHRDDIAGIRWIYGASSASLVTGDLNADSHDDLAKVTTSDIIQYSIDLSTWVDIPADLKTIVTGDLNGDGNDDIAGVNSVGQIWYTTGLSSWTNIPGTAAAIVTGDLDGDGDDDIAGINPDGMISKIFYTTDLSTWTPIPGLIKSIVTGDLDGDGDDDIAGINPDGMISKIFYTTDLSTWTPIPGLITLIITGDLDGDGDDDIAGINPDGMISKIFYTTNLSTWTPIPGLITSIVAGDFDGNGKDDIAGINPDGVSAKIFYTTDLVNWISVPGALDMITTGNFNADGRDDLAGVNSSGMTYYTTDLATWTDIP